MSNFDTVVLDGEMGLFTKVKEGDLPYYTGETEVTPSNETQTLPTADTIVTSNITVNPIPEMDLEEVEVTYTPDEEGLTDTITPSTGYVGISEVEVTIEPIDTDYVGSGIARNDSDDLTASGATITAPAGYYEEAATKSVESGSAVTPATEIIANPSISVGNDGSITASVSATQSVTPTVEAGYVSSGTAGTITVSGSGSSQLSTQAGATITPSTSQQTAVAAGKFTTGAVTVDPIPSEYIIPTGTKTIDENGTGIDVSAFAAVDVAVPGDTPTLQTKSVSYTPTETAQSESVTPSAGYDGLDKVNVSVAAIPGDYVGSSVTRRSSTDLSASGATITAPAGYYESAASKAVASGSASTPATSITANPSISVSASGLITATASASQSVTPTVSAGYVASGTAGTVSVSGSATQQLSTQAATTITPTTSSQTAVSAGKYTTGAVTVDPIPSQYIVPTGTKSITENGTGIDVAAFESVDVNVSGGGGSILPTGYTQLDYVILSGTQYAVIDYTPVQNDKIDCTFMKTDRTGCLFSAGAGTYQWLQLDYNYYKYFASGNAPQFSPTLSTGHIYHLTADATATASSPLLTTSVASSPYGGALGSSEKLHLGNRANNSSYFNGYIFEFILSNSGTEKIHLVPCKQDSTEYVGFYDLISDTFIKSNGSDEFIAGPESLTAEELLSILLGGES